MFCREQKQELSTGRPASTDDNHKYFTCWRELYFGELLGGLWGTPIIFGRKLWGSWCPHQKLNVGILFQSSDKWGLTFTLISTFWSGSMLIVWGKSLLINHRILNLCVTWKCFWVWGVGKNTSFSTFHYFSLIFLPVSLPLPPPFSLSIPLFSKKNFWCTSQEPQQKLGKTIIQWTEASKI